QGMLPLPATAKATPPGKAQESAPRKPDAAEAEFTPQARAVARTAAARNAKFDRSRYEVVCSLEGLEAWIARARERGRIVVCAEATSSDPMQATLCGSSLALSAHQTCYVATAHRTLSESGH